MERDLHVMQCGYTVCSETWGMVNESALFYRVYYVYGGEAWLCRENKIEKLQKGKLYLFPVMSLYTMWHEPLRPLDVLWFHVEMPFGKFTDFPQYTVEKDSALGYLLEAMKKVVNEKAYIDEIEKMFSAFIGLLENQMEFGKNENYKMQSVLTYMEEHISEDLQIKEMAKYVGMERSYFSRKFKMVFKMSPMQYLMAMKMSFAARELLKGSSVYQAAMYTGYKDEKAFSRAFKSYMEISPGKYKRSHMLQP